jgi:hypothetical protein
MSNPGNIQEVMILKELPDNWDGEGAVAFNDKVLTNAVSILNGLGETDVQVSGNNHGTVSLEWSFVNGDQIHLEVGKTQASMYIQITDQETEYFAYENLKPAVVSDIVVTLRRFV